MRLTAQIHIKHGALLTTKNAHRIVARSTRPTDPDGNPLPSPINRYRECPPYFQRWTIVKDEAGFRFREIKNGSGIGGGYHQTVRSLVMAVLNPGYPTTIVVEVQP